MATYSPEEIARMKDELRKDLEALERVERLLASRNGASHAHAEPERAPRNTRPLSEFPPPEQPTPVELGVKTLCIAGLQGAGELGAAPKDLLRFFKERGYVFSSDANGSASITTALSRLISGGKVRRADGRYYWVER